MWFLLALSFALLSSLNTLIYKVVLGKGDEYFVAWISSVLSLPFLALMVFFFYQVPRIDSFFALGITGTVLLNVVAGILSFRALRLTDISLIAPISAFNPLFTTLISFLTLRETPDLKGIVGIVVIVLGAYFLNLDSIRKGLLSPFKKLFSEKGVVLALICSFIWGITPIFEKTAILHTSPQVPAFVSLTASSFLALFLFPIMAKKSKNPFAQFRFHFKPLLLAGFLGSLAAVAAFTAFSMTNLGYVTAIFKLSMIFDIIWGFLFLKEAEIGSRILGAVVMLGGVFLLVS